ncbi:class I SAM-dependent methyltransferase [Streptomyces albus]|uniref:class I SAM-dependent methyltransferase n=1 Tax=Streptomyces sp. NRRL F-5639 TaxID=1463867 RepID=UPI0004C8C644|nr:class I SAM-dependent methyltransferase [Streptomyces sp. NRRL F-5639]KPC91663.1 hypothetical protein ADL27_29330 [Streptomyces sp. NRRL F-6602]
MSRRKTAPQYDAIGAQWEDARVLPTVYPERDSFLRLVGDVAGKRVLDLACGDGFYTRSLKERGASRALGLDVSPAMIEAARAAERSVALGTEYLVGDAAWPDLSGLGGFDLVTAAYLLNYARNEEELTDMCRGARSVLGTGRFVGVTQNPRFSFDGPRPDPYGFVFEERTTTPFGTHIRVTAALEPPVTFETCLIRPEVYERAFTKAGFGTLRWLPMAVPAHAEKQFGEGYWDAFLANPPIVMFEALG